MLDKTDKIYKNRPIIDFLMKKFREYYVPEQELSLDEGMIPCEKTSNQAVYKVKANKVGFEIFLLCKAKSGYIINAKIYTGKREDANTIVDLGVTGNLVMRISFPYKDQNYCLYTDRFYTSVALCEYLLRVDTLLCGTVQSNRKRFPKELVKRKMDRGRSELRFNGKCAAIVWCDKKPIYFVTSTHIDAPLETVLRYDAHEQTVGSELSQSRQILQSVHGRNKNGQLTRLQRCRRCLAQETHYEVHNVGNFQLLHYSWNILPTFRSRQTDNVISYVHRHTKR